MKCKGACTPHGVGGKCAQNSSRKIEVRDKLEEIKVDGDNIKINLSKISRGFGLDLSDSEKGPQMGSSGQDEHSVCRRCGEFLECMNSSQVLEKDCGHGDNSRKEAEVGCL
jgi:ribosomal protein L37E